MWTLFLPRLDFLLVPFMRFLYSFISISYHFFFQFHFPYMWIKYSIRVVYGRREREGERWILPNMGTRPLFIFEKSSWTNARVVLAPPLPHPDEGGRGGSKGKIKYFLSIMGGWNSVDKFSTLLFLSSTWLSKSKKKIFRKKSAQQVFLSFIKIKR